MLRPVGVPGRGHTPFGGCPKKLSQLWGSTQRWSPGHSRASYHAHLAAAAAAAAVTGSTAYRLPGTVSGSSFPANNRQLCPHDIGVTCLQARRNPPWRGVSAQSMLQQIDYSFYNEIERQGGVISEELLWERLRPLLDYLPPDSRQKVQEALSLAYDAHGGQARRSGEKYVTHPLEVARILAELRMDCDSLAAGLLHDTVEDTSYVTLEEIGEWFGEGVMKIVEGETRFSKLSHLTEAAPPGAPTDLKALDLQQLFLAMTDEVRIIVVKLADRLHNMRTLGSMPPHKQHKIADETLRVFAPLARLLGLYSIKEELEALSFLYTRPDEHNAMVEQINRLRDQQGPAVEAAMAALERRLEEDPYLRAHGTRWSISFHTKALYSLHRKQQLSGRPIKELRDVAQLQLVIQPLQGSPPIDDRQLCYHVMGLVHTMWAPIPGKVKDYIASPKPNGYQSIHTTVLPLGVPNLVPLEIHVRTATMHRLSQYGVAAEQWPYPASGTACRSSPSATPLPAPKPINGLVPTGMAGPKSPVAQSLPQPINGFASWPEGGSEASGKGDRIEHHVTDRHANWLSSIREWQEEFLSTMPPREFVDCVTDDLFGKGVFVFTPSGQSMRLPKGATVVDFAYHVHTDIGNHMKSAIVNGAPVLPDHRLSNAEVVEIVHDSGADGCCVTAVDVLRHKRWQPATRSARHKIAQFIKAHDHLLHPDPQSPDGRMMRHGILDRVLDMGQPRWGGSRGGEASEEKCIWLLVRCSDRPAMLADIAQCIADHGHNIVSYEGRGCPPGDANQSFMQFAVTGNPAQRPAMVQAMKSTWGVATVEAPSRDPSQLSAPSVILGSASEESNGGPFSTQSARVGSQTADRDYSGKWDQTQGSGWPRSAHSNDTSPNGDSDQRQGSELAEVSPSWTPTAVAGNSNGISSNRLGVDHSSNGSSSVNGSSSSSSSSNDSCHNDSVASDSVAVDDSRLDTVRQSDPSSVRQSNSSSSLLPRRHRSNYAATASWFRPPFA